MHYEAKLRNEVRVRVQYFAPYETNANEISFISLLKAESKKPKAFQFKQSQEVRL